MKRQGERGGGDGGERGRWCRRVHAEHSVMVHGERVGAEPAKHSHSRGCVCDVIGDKGNHCTQAKPVLNEFSRLDAEGTERSAAGLPPRRSIEDASLHAQAPARGCGAGACRGRWGEGAEGEGLAARRHGALTAFPKHKAYRQRGIPAWRDVHQCNKHNTQARRRGCEGTDAFVRRVACSARRPAI